MDNQLSKLNPAQMKKLSGALVEADYVLMKKYQYDLPQYLVVPPPSSIQEWDVAKHTRIFKLERIAYDKNEDNLEKLSNVYNALFAVDSSVILLIDSDGENVDFYMGTKSQQEQDIQIAFKTLEKALRGNFPGCVIKNLTKRKIEQAIKNVFAYRDDSSTDKYRTISAVSGISSDRMIAGHREKTAFTQGIEKLVDAMRGETYTMLLIADPVQQRQIDQVRDGYEQLYSKLVPFSGAQLSLGYTSGKTLTDSITNGVSDTVSHSLTLSQSHSHITSSSQTSTNTAAGASFFVSASHSSSKTNSTSDTDTEGRAETTGSSKTKSFSLGLSQALSEGESRGLQIRTEEKSVTALLSRIDIQLKRLAECSDLGMWNCAAYFIADDIQTSKAAASTYQALIRGENSGLEAITINTWSWLGEEAARQNYDRFCAYLQKICHPELFINACLPATTPTALISGAELTFQAGLPQKSIPGMAVAHYAAFGREIQSQVMEHGSTIALGKIFHMGVEEAETVLIDKESLSAHTFVTGSTGAGKSNAVYQLLTELGNKQIPYLVIEPAKGEYKNIFGNLADVSVYGTNPNKTEMLKINPFRFPRDIHVLEHIDRLIEIFNVCWPMYAAMPAVLKEAVERAYQAAGWDFETSLNAYEPAMYPTFADVLAELYAVINASDYSAELKGNYAGSLVTRVKSLTTGLNGQIFVFDEVDNQVLFDSKVIVDLSRVASAETKALIMGILVMRLQEHRMAERGMNRSLRHITVLEEAHHLLKRTSTEQSMEGANLLGKSVEMLSQSIAEMRTYGEGFIIADQSPNMLDMSVIRNTNTKIILRLPDMSDRELCGRAANLNDEQLIELAKLPTGVAAVYQNNWIEPVLCKISRFEMKEQEYRYVPRPKRQAREQTLKESILRCLLAHSANEKVEYSLEDMCQRVIQSGLPALAKRKLIRTLKNADKEIPDVCEAVSCIFDTSRIWGITSRAKNLEQWNEMFLQNLDFDFSRLGRAYSLLTMQCILKQRSMEDPEMEPIYNKWAGAMKEGVV